VRELVIVITDLYLLPEGPGELAQLPGVAANFPGIEHAARFGTHAPLRHGWREWLAHSIGRFDLAGAAPVSVAAAALTPAGAPQAAGSSWIATPVQLTPSLSGVHLDHGGILRLTRPELAMLAAAFHSTFGDSGCTLTPLPSGEFLLRAPGVTPIATHEPARCAGGDVAPFLPQGAQAAALRRLLAEIEMWLFAQPLNDARARRGQPPVTALWVWGAAGRLSEPERRTARDLPVAFGADAYVSGLWQLEGSECRGLPERLEAVLAEAHTERALVLLAAGGARQGEMHGSLAEGLARLDARFVSPALQTLARGELASLTLIANDTRRIVGRGSRLKLWRAPVGIEGFR